MYKFILYYDSSTHFYNRLKYVCNVVFKWTYLF